MSKTKEEILSLFNWSSEYPNYMAENNIHEAMDLYARQCVKEAELELPYAIGRLCEELEKDKSEGSYYYAWQANIAMAFQDEYRKELGDSPKMRVFIHEISNAAAKRFLDSLCYRPEPMSIESQQNKQQ